MSEIAILTDPLNYKSPILPTWLATTFVCMATGEYADKLKL